jgi:hypothetical protein
MLHSFLYVLLANSTSFAAFRLDGPGNANLVQTLDYSGPARALGAVVGKYLVSHSAAKQ